MTEISCDTNSEAVPCVYVHQIAPQGHLVVIFTKVPKTTYHLPAFSRSRKLQEKNVLMYRECKASSGYPQKHDNNTVNSRIGAFVLSTRVSLRWAD